jgi:hypothetical protein
MGLYSFVPGQTLPTRISQQIEQLLSQTNSGSNVIRLQYDDLYQGIHVFITPSAAPAVCQHLFFEFRTGAWWQDEFSQINFNPLATCILDGNLPGDRRTLVGSWDGYVRTMDPTATTDDGNAIASEVFIGPLLTRDMDEVHLKDLQALLGAASGTVNFNVYVGETAEIALSNAPVASGQWSAGRNLNTFIRRAGHAIWVEVLASVPWSMEAIRCRVHGKGKVPRRYKSGY